MHLEGERIDAGHERHLRRDPRARPGPRVLTEHANAVDLQASRDPREHPRQRASVLVEPVGDLEPPRPLAPRRDVDFEAVDLRRLERSGRVDRRAVVERLGLVDVSHAEDQLLDSPLDACPELRHADRLPVRILRRLALPRRTVAVAAVVQRTGEVRPAAVGVVAGLRMDEDQRPHESRKHRETDHKANLSAHGYPLSPASPAAALPTANILLRGAEGGQEPCRRSCAAAAIRSPR